MAAWCVVEVFDLYGDDGIKAVWGPFESEQAAREFLDGLEFGEVQEMKAPEVGAGN